MLDGMRPVTSPVASTPAPVAQHSPMRPLPEQARIVEPRARLQPVDVVRASSVQAHDANVSAKDFQTVNLASEREATAFLTTHADTVPTTILRAGDSLVIKVGDE